ncbi:hypothetical protein BH09ACT5_BH09ACT5_14310 [soil metagenome]
MKAGRRGTRFIRGIAMLAAAVLAGSLLPALAIAPAPADAAVGSDFNPGNIISDAVFYDSGAMSAAQIQAFIDAREVCAAGYTCLEDYRQDTWTRPADAQCGQYNGVPAQRASDIIWNVAQACGVNPQVLLVLLEKEQSLVSSSAPSSTRFERATGYACPDTAPCDAQFFGFYNQVYKAAWQYERYRLNPGSYNYRAGRVNTILWNPNTACGSSQVYIENQATAGLYIYTPYQPNQAALNNMYGTGDDCSSYGNRNFFRIFTDWFGSTGSSGSFMKTADDPTIYLVSGTYKYPVPNGEILQAYLALGPWTFVSAARLAEFTTGIPLGQLIRDSSTGEIFYSDRGVNHHVLTCDQLIDWATSCSKYIDLTPNQIRRLTRGNDLGMFALSASSGAVFYVKNGTKRWIHSGEDMVALAGSGDSSFITLGPTALATLADGPDYVSPGTVIRPLDGSATYLATSTALLPVDPPQLGAEFTAKPVVDVSPLTVTSGTVGSPLALVVTCGTNYYAASAGKLWRLQAGSSFGLPVTALDTATCAALAKSSQSVSGALFLRSPSGAIYYISKGKKLHQTSMDAVLAKNGGTVPVWLTVSDAVLGRIPDGADILAPGTLVKSPNAAEVAFVDGSRRIPIDLFETAYEFGASGYTVVPDATLAAYPSTGALLTVVVTCGADYYIAGGGTITRIATNSSSGLPVTALDPTTCAVLTKSPNTVSGPLFVRSNTSGAIYYVTGGKKQHMTSGADIDAITGGAPTLFIPLRDPVLARIADAAPLLRPGMLVKSPNSPEVAFIDGSRRIPIDLFETAYEFGSSGYSVLPDSTLASYPSTGSLLTLVVTCGSDYYIAGGGTLTRIASNSSSGLPVTALDATTCAALAKSPNTVPGPLFVRANSSGAIYYIVDGKKQYMSSGAQIDAITGGVATPFIPLRDVVVARIPN